MWDRGGEEGPRGRGDVGGDGVSVLRCGCCFWVCVGVVAFPDSDVVDDCEGGSGVSPLCTFEKVDE